MRRRDLLVLHGFGLFIVIVHLAIEEASSALLFNCYSSYLPSLPEQLGSRKDRDKHPGSSRDQIPTVFWRTQSLLS